MSLGFLGIGVVERVVMHTIEFHTEIEDDTIRIPKEYSDHLRKQSAGSSVRVVIYVSDHQYTGDYVERLLSNPIRVDDFAPLGRIEIYDRD